MFKIWLFEMLKRSKFAKSLLLKVKMFKVWLFKVFKGSKFVIFLDISVVRGQNFGLKRSILQ